MKLSAILGAILLAATAYSQCQVRPRKEIRTLSDSEWTTFANAVKSLQSGSAPTQYDKLVKMHVDNTNTVHGGSNFFPWHRWYLRYFETALQKVNSGIMLPYWNWAYDSQAPERSVVFSAGRFGGNGQGANRCVTNGAFANWQPYYPRKHCLSRNFNGGNRIASVYSTDVINSIISRSRTFDEFRRSIEMNPHGVVHVGIGGDMGEMISPNDPIFWMHHAYVDKIWWERQKIGSNSKQYDGTNPDGSRATVNDVLPSSGNVRVSAMFRVEDLCYTYQELQVSVPAAPTPAPNGGKKLLRRNGANLVRRGDTAPVVDPDDREELVNLKIPKALPDAWCKMNNIKKEEADGLRNTYAKVTEEINNIVGYIPVCALWMREDFLEQIVKEEKKVKVNVRGKEIVTDTKDLNPKDLVKDLKDKVHKKYGGHLRTDVDQYKDKLKGIVGNLITATKQALN